MPQKAKKFRLSGPHRTSKKVITVTNSIDAVVDEAPAELADRDWRGQCRAQLKLWSLLAWAPAYRPLLLAEAEAIGARDRALLLLSDYRRRQLQAGGLEAQSALEDAMLRVAADIRRELRERNKFYVPFDHGPRTARHLELARPGASPQICSPFVCVHSPAATACSSQVSTASWRVETKGRRVASRQYATKLLVEMQGTKPKPAFEIHDCVRHMAYDNAQQRLRGAAGHTRYGAVQRVDSTGVTINKTAHSVAFVAAYDLPVPASLIPLTHDDKLLLAERGPYTQDFGRIVPLMHHDHSIDFLNKLLEKSAAIAGMVFRLHRGSPTVAAIAVALLGYRPLAPAGADPVDDMPPVLHAKTSSHVDFVRTIDNAEDYYGAVPLVLGARCDGGGCLNGMASKRAHPEMYKHVLLLNGHWHSHGHNLLTDMFLYGKCLTRACRDRLGKSKVRARPHSNR